MNWLWLAAKIFEWALIAFGASMFAGLVLLFFSLWLAGTVDARLERDFRVGSE
ncbi:MAG TPA: hypothetical protein VNX86_04590 [Rhizomicrobium sp.]|jgi:hypothetical protein|nr:hypothetical protein [Rhizomicrobium sp.]